LRPRRHILLYCSSEIELSVLRLVLENKASGLAFRVHGVSRWNEAAPILGEFPCEVAVLIHFHPDDEAIFASVDLWQNYNLKTMFITSGIGNECAWEHVRVTVSLPKKTSVSEWMYRLRVLCQRKRGPKTVGKIPRPIIQSPDRIEMHA
jgi:hypothetical protein